MVDDDTERRLVRLLQVALVAVVAVGVWQRRVGIVVNAGVSLALTFVPAVLEGEYDLTMDPALALWLTAAVTVHAVGALGPYRTVPYYDSVAHALSASVVAAAGYTLVHGVETHREDVEIPSPYMAAVVLVVVLAAGVVWELLEFATELLASVLGGTALLAQYGVDDIVLDLAFNTAGGLVVALWGTDRLRSFARRAGRRLVG